MTYYRIVPKATLPLMPRQEANQKNNFRNEVFAKKSTARMARDLLEDPDLYQIIECLKSDGVCLS